MKTTARGQISGKRRLSLAHRGAIAQALVGRKQTPEHVANHAAAVRGRRNPKVSQALRGKSKTEAHKEAIRKTQLERKRALEAYEIGYKKDEDFVPFFGFSSETDY